MEGNIHHIGRTTSTQLEARRLIAQGDADIGDIVLAYEQTAGRGRFGRSWISPNGGLYATIICSIDPMLSLKAGLAVVRVLRSAGIHAGIKWPNDVLVDDLKIAGVLIEADGIHSLVGIGLNLTSSPLDTATYVAQYVEISDPDQGVRAIAKELAKISSGSFDLDEYRKACVTLGCPVRIDGIGNVLPVEGMATDIDNGGRLIIETREGKRAISSGDCLHLRRSNSNG